jgi:hypothetical protein
MPGSVATNAALVGGRRRGASVKTLKKMLKKAGLKTTGKKAALTRRAKKAHLKMRGGGDRKEDTAAALTAAVKAGGDFTDEKAAALAAGWTEGEVQGVIDGAKPAAPAEGGRHRRGHSKSRRGGTTEGGRRGIFGKLY